MRSINIAGKKDNLNDNNKCKVKVDGISYLIFQKFCALNVSSPYLV